MSRAETLPQTSLPMTPPTDMVARDDSQAVMAMLQGVVDRGITAEAVGVIERLAQLHERQQDRRARLEFMDALARFQAECPPVPRTSTVDFTTNTGRKVSYKSADLEQIMETSRDPMRQNGLMLHFDAVGSDGMLEVVGYLSHVGGHQIHGSFRLPTDNSNPGMSQQQKYAAAMTFGKRQVMLALLGLPLTDPDPEQGSDPTPISEDQLANLTALIEEVGADRGLFLTYLRVANLSDLPAVRYREAVAALEAKRKRGSK